MKDRLHGLFDYQRFRKNKRLDEIIAETEKKYIRKRPDSVLSLDELEHISAAGDLNAHSKKPFHKEDFDE